MTTLRWRAPVYESIHHDKIMKEGEIAATELNCWSCETPECCMLTTFMIVGPIIGFLLGGPVGILFGLGAGVIGGIFMNWLRNTK